MERLSFGSYVSKCVLGGELVYLVCLLGGFIPLRSLAATELHHRLFETLPGFVWGSMGSYVLGAVYTLVFSLIVGTYMVWMHNSSLRQS